MCARGALSSATLQVVPSPFKLSWWVVITLLYENRLYKWGGMWMFVCLAVWSHNRSLSMYWCLTAVGVPAAFDCIPPILEPNCPMALEVMLLTGLLVLMCRFPRVYSSRVRGHVAALTLCLLETPNLMPLRPLCMLMCMYAVHSDL